MTRVEQADDVTDPHHGAGADGGPDGLVGGAQAVVVPQGHDPPARDRPGEHHRAPAGREDRLTRDRAEVDTPVAGSVRVGRRPERRVDGRHREQWPGVARARGRDAGPGRTIGDLERGRRSRRARALGRRRIEAGERVPGGTGAGGTSVGATSVGRSTAGAGAGGARCAGPGPGASVATGGTGGEEPATAASGQEGTATAGPAPTSTTATATAANTITARPTVAISTAARRRP